MEANNKPETEELFIDINAENPVSEIESLCMQCEKNGTTRILMTKIPFFKEIILMAFSCPECGHKNSEIQPGQALAEQGIRIEVSVTNSKVKKKHKKIIIPKKK